MWRDQEEKRRSAGWRGRWHNLVHGTAQERRRLGRVWLEANPFVWLAARDWQPAALAWAVVVGEVLLWLVCWAAWPTRWPSVPNLFITATLLNSALGWMVCLVDNNFLLFAPRSVKTNVLSVLYSDRTSALRKSHDLLLSCMSTIVDSNVDPETKKGKLKSSWRKCT
jgi:MFS superfamily sulfate permease-like transporter